jgi:hypothetical protein
MDKVQKPSNSECYTPSSEPFSSFVRFAYNPNSDVTYDDKWYYLSYILKNYKISAFISIWVVTQDTEFPLLWPKVKISSERCVTYTPGPMT